ncbi:hypothetical protein [Methyloceanibacter caenitepidi]|uniref:Uncharacterized protein n=1 Tax=Methyloceanibacter caenitepidi TaxID=1384459 RepID=A0A0A8K250_9HYPH|nr:hypothetical protein [Methyloceanibacter caenitepidi]BAQ16074.1 hypothetical protein GL4_0611 [Methyloceanibacter caenitepidi]
MFKVEVIAETPEQMAGKLAGLAEIYREGDRFLKNYDKAKAKKGGADDSEPEEAEEVKPPKKPSGRKPKPQTIEAKAEPETEEAEAEGADDDKGEESGEPLTIDDVREEMKKYIDAAAVKSGDEATRRTEFKALLDEFKVPKLGELPEDKWPAMVKLAKKKLAEIS